MELTPQLRAWLVENFATPADASDEEFKAAAMKALDEGALSVHDLAELSVKDESSEGAFTDEVLEDGKSAGSGAYDALLKAVSGIANRLDGLEGSKSVEPNTVTDAKSAGQKMMASAPASQVRVVGAEEQYSTTKSAAICPKGHIKAGQVAEIYGRGLDTSSQLDKAVAGAYFKWAVRNSMGSQGVPRGLKMTDHDDQLMQYALHKMSWSGVVGGSGTEGSGVSKIDSRKLSDVEIKALIDDSTSGGLEAAPVAFDDAVILTPVLHGELFPLVNVVPISRGRRVEGFSLGNPTFTSGTAEGTAIGLFDTSSYISAFDTTVFNAVGAMEIGMDFEEDSPVNIGTLVAQRYGEKAMEWLDNQIMNGDGTTEPQGILNASGTTTVSSTNGATGPATVDDYEGLMFGLSKEYRSAADRARQVFISNDTSYKRARAIAVGSGDVRRVFGMETNTHGDYSLLGHDVKIQNDTTNADIAFCNLRYYRMYRRLGLNIRVETGGKELAQKNLKLVVVRMRFGGQLEQGGAAAKIVDAQS